MFASSGEERETPTLGQWLMLAPFMWPNGVGFSLLSSEEEIQFLKSFFYLFRIPDGEQSP
jgi:hypothetical protein